MSARARAITPATLAAAAEAGVWFFPVRAVSSLLGGSVDATATDLAWFVAAFTATVAIGTAIAGWWGLAPALFVVALAAGVAEGRGLETAQPGGYVVAGLVATGLALRAGALAVRDWREPVQLSFGVGAVALLVEVVGSGFAGSAGGPLLGAVVPAFFAGSLASRALSVRLAEGWGSRDGRRVLASVGVLAAAMGIGAGFGGAGGLLHRLGAAAAPVLGAVFGAFLWLFSQAARPFFWLMDRFDVDFSRLQRALEGFREDVERRASEAPPPEGGVLQRGLGLFVVAALILAVLMAFRRLRTKVHPAAVPSRDDVAVVGLGSEETRPDAPGRRPGRRLPADLVRRWYAQTLSELEALHLPRDPSRTPGEFRTSVVEAFPEAGQPFRILTAAYERVRYGARPPDQEALRALRGERSRLRTALKRASPLPVDEA